MTILVTGGSGFIGTNLVESLRSAGAAVASVDLRPPRHPGHADCFELLDVRDRQAVDTLIARIRPTAVYHLAARTDLDGPSLQDYDANVDGTANLVGALVAAGFTGRLVAVSSMLVCRNGYVPRHPTDYQPDTIYGQSKVEAEAAVRGSDLDWVICRPTSIWGPWFATPYRDFFDAVRAGRYVHPGRRDVTKAFGFVGNVVDQLTAAATAADAGSTFYVSDPHEYTVRSFADAVAVACGRRVRTAPVAALRVAGWVGDLAKRFGVSSSPPMTSFRLRNMLTSSGFDMSAIDALVTQVHGPVRIGLGEGVAATSAWLDDQERG